MSPNIELPTEYQGFIHKSRYARWKEEENRRESWEETVDRYIDYMCRDQCKGLIEEEKIEELRQGILNLEAMPSMRALMTSGPALARDNVAGFNCSYVAIDHPVAFDELLYILMCGTGVGFSVERQFVSKLPTVSERFRNTNSVIKAEDSKIGWANSYRELVSFLYSGCVPIWDFSELRQAGARLKTFGGRASGPKPLEDLFKFTISIFKNAAGRRLNSIECHDLCCKIGEVVVVGGVRRSAEISLSNPSDDRMRHAKSGEWWKTDPHRALANNSVCYTEKPGMDTFMREWLALYSSKSGERGIFNREAAKKQAARFGRRDPDHEFGTNPCCFTGDMKLLTSEGYKTFNELCGKDVEIVNDLGNCSKGKVWSSGTKKVIRLIFEGTDQEDIVCTPDHIFRLFNGEEREAKDLLYEYVETFTGATAYVETIQDAGEQEVFDFTEPETHWGVVNGCIVHNSEIILRSCQFCNLSEVVVRKDDTKESLLRKVRLATILGTLQSTLTDFRYLRDIWKTNTEEESLLGVSLTGIMDNEIMSGRKGKEVLTDILHALREEAVKVNAEWAPKLGVNPAAAITCVKPSGTVSQLVDCGSGIHPRHSEYYIRRVRADKKDPLAQTMIASGFPFEDDVMKPEHNAVFSFPMKAPEGAITRDDMTALEQLDLWLTYQIEWCEHKPSITVNVRESEWMGVGAWVYENFDWVSGISFLPYSDHSYQQAPYEEVRKEEYEKLLVEMPEGVDWKLLEEFEVEDTTSGTQELACSGGSCEVVDLTKD